MSLMEADGFQMAAAAAAEGPVGEGIQTAAATAAVVGATEEQPGAHVEEAK